LPGSGNGVPQSVPHGTPTVAQPPNTHTPVVVTAQPSVPMVDRQNNPGAVVSPPVQHVVLQGVAQPGPTSVTRPQQPLVTPTVTHMQLVPVHPQGSGNGLNVPPVALPTPTGSSNLQVPAQHMPVVIAAQPQGMTGDKPHNVGVVEVPTQPQGGAQTVAQPAVSAGLRGSGVPQNLPPALSDGCVRPVSDVDDRLLPGQGCLTSDKPRYVVWGDARNQRTRDMRQGFNKQGYRQLRSTGFERTGDGPLSYGLTIGDEHESGTVMGDLTRYHTDKQTIGSYAKYALNERWSVIGGVSYTRERTSVSHAPLTGGYRADHLGLMASLSGYLPDGDNWGVPSIHISHNFIRNHTGHIEGVWGGKQVSVVTPASREKSGAATASYDMGRTVHRSAGWAYVLYGQVAAHYDYTHGGTTRWSGDLRAGLRVHAVSNLTLDVSLSRLGIMNGVSNREIRMTLLQSF
jgi:hypothetical protein